jgi:hypothetical protein
LKIADFKLEKYFCKFVIMNLHPQYITDKKGKKKSVVLSMKEYKRILEELEDLEDIRLYDEAKMVKELDSSF